MEQIFITRTGKNITLETCFDNISIETKKFQYSKNQNIPHIPLAWKRMNFEIVGYIGEILYAKDSMNFVTELGTLEEFQQLFKDKIFEFVT